MELPINSEIEAIRQVRVEMNAAIQAAGNDTQKINMEQYRNRENEIFNQLKARRRAQYANVRLEASRWGRAVARDQRYLMGHRHTEADLRIDSPASGEWVIIPESVHWIEHCKRINQGGGAEVRNPRVEGNGYTVHLWGRGPDLFHSNTILEITLIATYRYNDATLNRKVDEDMVILRNRIEAALK